MQKLIDPSVLPCHLKSLHFWMWNIYTVLGQLVQPASVEVEWGTVHTDCMYSYLSVFSKHISLHIFNYFLLHVVRTALVEGWLYKFMLKSTSYTKWLSVRHCRQVVSNTAVYCGSMVLLISSLWHILRWCLKINKNLFISYPFQFFIHTLPYRAAVYKVFQNWTNSGAWSM